MLVVTASFFSWIINQGLGNLRNSLRLQNEQGGLRDQSSSSSDASARQADVPLDSMQLPVNFTGPSEDSDNLSYIIL